MTGDEEGRPTRPPSVRDVMTGGPGRGADEPAGQAGAADPGSAGPGAEAEGSTPEPGRPTPVRLAMEVERDHPEPVVAPERTFTVEDRTWVVRVEGRTRSGQPEDAGAPLLFLTFARGEDEETRVRETIAVGRRLEELTELQLEELLERARPFRSGFEPSELFPATRRDRGGGR